MRHTANDDVQYCNTVRSDRSLSRLDHCLEWYKLLLRIHLLTPDRGLIYPVSQKASPTFSTVT